MAKAETTWCEAEVSDVERRKMAGELMRQVFGLFSESFWHSPFLSGRQFTHGLTSITQMKLLHWLLHWPLQRIGIILKSKTCRF